METIIGLVGFYVLIHAIVIIFKKIGNLTDYEKVVMWASFGVFILFVLGIVSE
jgi:hypothetical protein